MDENQTKLAEQIAEILKDQTLTAEERLKKMRSKLNSPSGIEISKDEIKKQSSTYDSQEIRKAALRNKILNKDQ